jgi:hypothetical protein
MRALLAAHKTVIYGLRKIGDPEVRYVGRTAKDPRVRLQRHRWQAASPTCERYVSRWIRSVDFQIEIIVLESDPSDPRQSEREWIVRLRERGDRLTNLTHGGEGAPPTGFLLSPEQRRKIREANLRRWADPAARERLAESNRRGQTGMLGKKHSLATRQRISASQKGKPKGSPSEETRRRMSEAGKRRAARERGVMET